jgi:hypothetical protein
MDGKFYLKNTTNVYMVTYEIFTRNSNTNQIEKNPHTIKTVIKSNK